MKRLCFYLVTAAVFCVLVSSASGATIYNNLTTTNSMGIATRPDSPGLTEIEGADDFFLSARTLITSASIVGLIVPGPNGGVASITDVVAEMYRIFPADSDDTRVPHVPTRANSPSDVAFDSRDSGVSGQLSFTLSTLAPTFTVLNTVQPGGIHPSPGQTTGGNGALTGQEVQINMTFLTPFNLVDSHPPSPGALAPRACRPNTRRHVHAGAARRRAGSGCRRRFDLRRALRGGGCTSASSRSIAMTRGLGAVGRGRGPHARDEVPRTRLRAGSRVDSDRERLAPARTLGDSRPARLRCPLVSPGLDRRRQSDLPVEREHRRTHDRPRRVHSGRDAEYGLSCREPEPGAGGPRARIRPHARGDGPAARDLRFHTPRASRLVAYSGSPRSRSPWRCSTGWGCRSTAIPVSSCRPSGSRSCRWRFCSASAGAERARACRVPRDAHVARRRHRRVIRASLALVHGRLVQSAGPRGAVVAAGPRRDCGRHRACRRVAGPPSLGNPAARRARDVDGHGLRARRRILVRSVALPSAAGDRSLHSLRVDLRVGLDSRSREGLDDRLHRH